MARPPCREPWGGARPLGRDRRSGPAGPGAVATSAPSGRRFDAVSGGRFPRARLAAGVCSSARARTAPSWLRIAGGGAPHRQPVDLVVRRSAAASRRWSARPSRSARRAGSGRRGGSTMRATSAGARTSMRARARRGRRPGVTSKSLTGIQNWSSGPTTRTPAATGSSPTSSVASRRAVAVEVGVLGLGLAAREADLARVMVAVARRCARSGRRRASPVASG